MSQMDTCFGFVGKDYVLLAADGSTFFDYVPYDCLPMPLICMLFLHDTLQYSHFSFWISSLFRDAAAARGIMVFKTTEDKILELNATKAMAMAGPQGDRSHFGEYIQVHMLYRSSSCACNACIGEIAEAASSRIQSPYHQPIIHASLIWYLELFTSRCMFASSSNSPTSTLTPLPPPTIFLHQLCRKIYTCTSCATPCPWLRTLWRTTHAMSSPRLFVAAPMKLTYCSAAMTRARVLRCTISIIWVQCKRCV